MDAFEAVADTREFTYWTAVTSIRRGERRSEWEDNTQFRSAFGGNPIRLISFGELLDDVWKELSTTPAATELGRMVQLMKASRWSLNNPAKS